MRVFVTGASGFIGSAVVPELLAAGHEVTGLVRSDASAEAVARAGAGVHRGSLGDLDTLRAGAAAAEGVIHLAFNHDFSQYQAAADGDFAAVEAMGAELAGTNRPFVIASGTLSLGGGRVAQEGDPPDPNWPRSAAANAVVAMSARGVRSSVVRLPPTVHSDQDRHGFIPMLVQTARDKGVSSFIDSGSNRWPAVHQRDAARVFRLALEAAPSGSVVHAVAEQGVATKTIAEVIGRQLGVPTASIPGAAASEHFGWLGLVFATDCPTSSERTQALLGWRPAFPGLVEDLERGHYFER